MILNLRYVSYFKAPNGAYFDLLANEQLKNFFIKLKQLWQSISADNAEPISHFKKKFNLIFQANVREHGDVISAEVVALDDVNSFLNSTYLFSQTKIFPADIFKAVKSPIPKRATEVEDVRIVFDTGEPDTDDRIFIFNDGERNLVSLFDISRWVCQQDIHINRQVVNAALRFDLFRDNKTDNFFIDLRDVKSFLTYLDGSEKLLKRFNFQVFMTPTPGVSTVGYLGCLPFLTANFNETPFTIFKGNGFAENAFFFKLIELTEILGLDTDDENALDETVLAVGEFWDRGGRYSRLDFAPYIVRHCLARLWNGSNQDQPIIKTGWAFIRWFNEFLLNFYKDYVPIRCGAQWIPDSNFELDDTPTLDDSIKSFFDTFDRACNHFKKQIKEAHS